MSRSWLNFKEYKPIKLVDSKIRQPFDLPNTTHIICDIDKTYLETNFETISQMALIAFEDADDKITVAGAAEILNKACWSNYENGGQQNPNYLHFVSSSPPQLRKVLEKKFLSDNIFWYSDTFKDQAYNLKKGRMDLLKQHVLYKSLAILNIISKTNNNTEFYFFGDNAEADSYIYIGIKLYLENKLSLKNYAKYLAIAEIEEGLAYEVISKIKKPRNIKINKIFIRNAPGYKLVKLEKFTDVLHLFDNYFEISCHLISSKLIPLSNLNKLLRYFLNTHNLAASKITFALNSLNQKFHDSPELTKAYSVVKTQVSQLNSDLITQKKIKSINNSESEWLELAKKWYEKSE